MRKHSILFLALVIPAAFLGYQNCGRFQVASDGGAQTLAAALNDADVAFVFNDEDADRVRTVAVSNSFEQAKVTIADFTATDVSTGSTKTVSLAAWQQRLAASAAGIRIALVTPTSTTCEPLNADPFMALAWTSKGPFKLAPTLMPSSLPAVLELGRRQNSCDAYYDLVGDQRAAFLAALSEISDTSSD